MLKSISMACAAATLMFASADMAAAQSSDSRVNASTDWSVFVENGQCWVVSAPKTVENTRGGKKVNARRSDILLFVTFDPKRGLTGEVSFTGGYSFKKDHPIKMQIGSSSYTLYPEGEWAWPESASDDAKIRESMKRGATAVITASSARPTLTKDTFSLKGFTAALEDAQKRCAG